MKRRGDVLPDSEDAVFWDEEREPGLGLELLDHYERRLELALAEPGVGTPGRTRGGLEFRRYRLERFGRYAIVMSELDGIPTVIAFEHGRRRSEHWAGRVRP